MELRKCPVCGGKLRSEAIGWICYDCQGFIDMQGVFHEHKEKPFMPPMTNADRIRAMSDEELAEVFATIQTTFAVRLLEKLGCPTEETAACYEETKKEHLEWLKQPAKENDHE